MFRNTLINLAALAVAGWVGFAAPAPMYPARIRLAVVTAVVLLVLARSLDMLPSGRVGE